MTTNESDSAAATLLDQLHKQPTVTAELVAELFDVRPETVYRWGREGTIPCLRLGPRVVRFRSADVLAMLDHTPAA